MEAEGCRGSLVQAGIFKWEATTNEAKVIWIILRDSDDRTFKAHAEKTFKATTLMFAQKFAFLKFPTTNRRFSHKISFCMPAKIERWEKRSMEKRKIRMRDNLISRTSFHEKRNFFWTENWRRKKVFHFSQRRRKEKSLKQLVGHKN